MPEIVLGSLRMHFMYMRVKVTFTSMKQYSRTHSRSVKAECQCQGNKFISYLFSNNKFLISLRILCSILFGKVWKLMVYYFALFYYVSKYLKIDCCKRWTVASYFWTCHESIFKACKSCYFSINTGFLRTEKSIIGSLR